MRSILFAKLSSLVLLVVFACHSTRAQTTEFTYQGKLNDTGTPSATYDFTFRLCNSLAADCSTPLATQTITGVPVSNGIFAVKLDFGAGVFDGSARWLEIAVKRPADGTYQTLSPRQTLTSEPYSITANNALRLGGIQANQYLTMPSANTNYIQNTTSQQTSSNFNVSGTGTANIFDAATQFNIGGNRILGSGSENLFAGIGAGFSNTTGIENSFFGRLAGNANSTGSGNSFFGFVAGRNTSSGSQNSFFGNRVGMQNTTGNFNSFFGHRAGEINNGSSNSFFGTGTGLFNTLGNNNTFLGHDAGNTNTTGSFNTIIGDNADVFGGNFTNATALGANALVTQSDSLILGSINGVNNATADVKVGIGITAPTFKLQVVDSSNTGLRVQTNATGGTVASFGGNGAFEIDSPGSPGGRFRVAENGEVSIGRIFDGGNLTVYGNALLNTVTISNGVTLNVLGSAGSTTLCRNASNQISTCSSSLRYKTNIAPFSSGLSVIRQLSPISFDWKQGGMRDVGFGAEEVAKINPMFVTYNDKGEVEGVKYDRLSVAFVNAFKEQQAQIAGQQDLIKQQAEKLERQQAEIDALKAVVCASNPTAAICQPQK